jgi:hypothetical protein
LWAFSITTTSNLNTSATRDDQRDYL